MQRIPLALALAVSASANAADFTIDPTFFNGDYRWNVQIGSAPARINATLSVNRGRSYVFDVSATTLHPFWITTDGIWPITTNAFAGTGLSANGLQSHALITFDVPQDAPDTLFYNCGNHSTMVGEIDVSIFRDTFGD